MIEFYFIENLSIPILAIVIITLFVIGIFAENLQIPTKFKVVIILTIIGIFILIVGGVGIIDFLYEI
jgi:hypothetical protein